VSVVVEKPEKFVLELWELLLTREASIILGVIVEKMNCFWFEKCSDFRILMNDVS